MNTDRNIFGASIHEGMQRSNRKGEACTRRDSQECALGSMVRRPELRQLWQGIPRGRCIVGRARKGRVQVLAELRKH